MAKYNLNEALKKRAASAKKDSDAEIRLDDISRVKVLSPGRQVFKRFIRNRLAIFGSVTLIVMFVFSFLGPFVYPYGQKEIFYRYDTQNVNYALARINTSYNESAIDDSIEVERTVGNSMNSNIKKMVEEDKAAMIVSGAKGSYQIRRYADNIYVLSSAELIKICSIGHGSAVIGTYDSIKKTMTYTGDEVEGLAEAIAAAGITGKGGSVEYQGITYTLTKSKGKTYEVTASFEGIHYMVPAMGEEFEAALTAAAETGESFEFEGKTYVLLDQTGSYLVCEMGRLTDAAVYSNYTFDFYETGMKASDEFRTAALLATSEGGEFKADGRTWTMKGHDDTFIITDDAGNEYAELTLFSVRRYSGEDSMEYGLKKAIAEKVNEMAETGEKKAELTYDLPMQGDDGRYVYDDDGKLQYVETDMVLTQRNVGEYVITCDQINYVIDIFSSPSAKHPLGTDGDGFDVLARIMYGGRISLLVGFVVVFLELLLGVIMGGIAGFYGKWVDNLIMRLVDIFYCLPSMPIMIILGAVMDALRMDTYVRLMIMMAALGIMGWASVARLVRGQILSLREQEFMVAAEATGIKVRDRIFRHLVPNVMPQLIVTATMGVGSVILTESTLSFLGLGVKHPLATWGTIINSVSSASAMAHYAFIWIPVGLLICLTVIAFNFVGDGLRDAYDPKSKR